MPRFYQQNVLSKTPNLDPSHELESPMDNSELPPGHSSEMEDPYFDPDPLKTYVSWKAVSRPFRKKNRSFYTTVAVLLILISGIAFFAGEKLLIGVLLALGFLVYVLNFVSPEDVEYKISSQGVTIGEHFYHWAQLDSFWFSDKDGYKILNILTQIRFPGMLMLVMAEDVDKEEVKRACAKFLPYHEIAPRGFIEKWTESLQKHFPLENPHK